MIDPARADHRHDGQPARVQHQGAQILTRGGDNWICFPVIRKNGTGSTQNSAEYGLAYLANP